ncbi:histidine phosphatase family protein [Streptomyces sp. NPDC021093]|uniref:histidine phosphatase family protein n=1 Tax=Streptomyces sp. NPDC021093 TaxID=3365112 RepID=UPI0037A54B5A
MTTTHTTRPRHLYIARHAEAAEDESGLTDAGRRQAVLLGQRLRGVPLSAIHHGPLSRTTETARLVAEQLGQDVRPRMSEAAGDYVPYEPVREELPAGIDADRYLGFVAGQPAEDREKGPRLAALAMELFTGPADVPAVPTGGADATAVQHELVVTHNFLAAWFVRAAHEAPAWRWIGLNLANAALTVIRYAPGRPASVLVLNDMGHLPAELRWTGYPPELHV